MLDNAVKSKEGEPIEVGDHVRTKHRRGRRKSDVRYTSLYACLDSCSYCGFLGGECCHDSGGSPAGRGEESFEDEC